MREIRVGLGCVIHGDFRDVDVASHLDSVGAVVWDPPYDDARLVGVERAGVAPADVLAFGDPSTIGPAILGWGRRFRHLFTWDAECVSGRAYRGPLQRTRHCAWLGESPYAHCGAHLDDKRLGPTWAASTRHLWTMYRHNKRRRETACLHEKPLPWVLALVGNCTNGPVYDPMAGSGTTAIACELLGRPFLCVERDAALVDLIVERHRGRFG